MDPHSRCRPGYWQGSESESWQSQHVPTYEELVTFLTLETCQNEISWSPLRPPNCQRMPPQFSLLRVQIVKASPNPWVYPPFSDGIQIHFDLHCCLHPHQYTYESMNITYNIAFIMFYHVLSSRSILDLDVLYNSTQNVTIFRRLGFEAHCSADCTPHMVHPSAWVEQHPIGVYILFWEAIIHKDGKILGMYVDKIRIS